MDADLIGYSESFTREAFKIVKVQHTYPYTYLLEDLKGDTPEAILGAVYESEITLADPDLSKKLAEEAEQE